MIGQRHRERQIVDFRSRRIPLCVIVSSTVSRFAAYAQTTFQRALVVSRTNQGIKALTICTYNQSRAGALRVFFADDPRVFRVIIVPRHSVAFVLRHNVRVASSYFELYFVFLNYE
jgi:hypothetical protein